MKLRNAATWTWLVACVLSFAPVAATEGAILVANPSAGADSGSVILVDPASGLQTLLARFVDPYGMDLENASTLLVADANANAGLGALFRLDLRTRAITLVTTGGILLEPTGVAVIPGGSIFVLDGHLKAVVRVDPASGAQSLLTQGGFLRNPAHLGVTRDGQLLVTDANAFGGPGGGIVINPYSGGQELLFSGGAFQDPIATAIESDGGYLVTDVNGISDLGAVFRIAPAGGQSVLFQGGILQDPMGILVDQDGSVYVTGRNSADYGEGLLLRIDAITGAATVVSRGGYLGFSPTLKIWTELPVPVTESTWGRVKATYRE